MTDFLTLTNGIPNSVANAAQDSINGDIESPKDRTYTLILKATKSYTVNSITTKLASGTLTAAVKIDGVDVTGLSSISVTSTELDSVATGANSISVGNTLTIVVSSSATPVDMLFTLNLTEV